jgi:hypothetical protein
VKEGIANEFCCAEDPLLFSVDSASHCVDCNPVIASRVGVVVLMLVLPAFIPTTVTLTLPVEGKFVVITDEGVAES